ncbi:MAG: TonB-dependent receptor [Rhizomicrobium sp.]
MLLRKSGVHTHFSRYYIGVSMVALCSALSCASAVAQDTETLETVTVTGFRASLEKALDNKRTALDASDSIMAEDIAKFPDLNLSESLQRIPGVALSRDAGEGRQISVRGLDPTFSRVRINGMEALATTGSSSTDGTNRGRSFDYNIFASELFSSINVHKSNGTEVEEGSLGATIDLHTAHPFDQSGPVLTGSANFGYNDLGKNMNPRFALLASNVFLGGRLGVMATAAYTIRNTLENGWSTVRWMNDGTDDDGTGTTTTQQFKSVMGATSGDEYDTVNAAYHPRFPRYDVVNNHAKRLGLTGAIQWQPDDATLFTLDAMFADYAVQRTENYLEANSFSLSQGWSNLVTYKNYSTGTSTKATGTSTQTGGVRAIAVTDYTLDTTTNNLTSMTANNVGLRTEDFLAHIDSRFMQATLDASHTFSENWKVHGLMGWSESHMRNPVQTTMTYDYANPGAQGFSYSYSGYKNAPYINYGNVDVTSTSGWFLSQLRMRGDFNYNSFLSGQVDTEYKTLDWLTLKSGLSFKNYGFRTSQIQRTNGTTSSQDYVIPSDMGSADISQYSKLVTLRGLDVPSGTPTLWMAPDINKWAAAYDIFNQSAGNGAYKMGIEPSLSSNGSVTENDYGGWVQADWDSAFYGVPFRGNVGVRYALTETAASGYTYLSSATSETTVKQTYHDILPAMNMVLEPSDTFFIRLNAAYAMARPGLTSMVPGGSVSISGSNRTASVGNPHLKPYRSKNLDLAFEWYFHKGSMLSIAGFYKHIDSLVQSVKSYSTFQNNSLGLPDSMAIAACGSAYGAGCNEYDTIWTFSTSKNMKGAPLYGSEINLQQQFDFLPAPFDNMGFLGNVTMVQATQTYYNSDGSVYATADLTGLSRTSYNTTLYYDDTVFQARISAAFRSKYIASMNPGNLNDALYTDGTMNIDFSSSYKISESVMLTLEAINLTNQAKNQYVDSSGKRSYNWHQTGRELLVGFRYAY